MTPTAVDFGAWSFVGSWKWAVCIPSQTQRQRRRQPRHRSQKDLRFVAVGVRGGTTSAERYGFFGPLFQ